jgi:hypothetical protein
MAGVELSTQAGGDFYYYPASAGGNNYNLVTNPFADATWHHVAVSHEFATKTVAIYIDGVAQTFAITNVPTAWQNVFTAADWYWGGLPAMARFAGTLDEVRVANVVRSPDWIATEYANQSSPGTFYTVTPAE